MDPFIGEIRLLPYTYAPQDWLPCDGSSQSINEYTTLYAVIGLTYGGDGVKTFNLPDLRNFIPVGPNRSLASTVQLDIGKAVGEATVTLTASQIPSHNHDMNGKNTTTVTNRLTAPANNAQPGPVLFNGTTSTTKAQQAFSTVNTPDTVFAPQTIGPSGSSAAHPNQQPYLPLNFMIAVNGIYPAPE